MTQSLPRNGTHGSLQHTRSTDDLLGTAARSNGALNSTTLHVDPPARGTTNPVLGDAAAGRFVKPAREASAFGAVA